MSGNVEKVWMETTVDYSHLAEWKDVKHADGGEYTKYDTANFTSLEVQDPSAEWQLAVEAHLKRVREFVSGSIKGQPLTVSKVGTEVCAKVDNGRKFAWVIPVNDTQCQPLTAGNVVPEEATVAALFRGAGLTVAVLGPVGSDAATAKQGTPATEPVKGGTQAVPGASPNKAPVEWPRNVPYDAIDLACKPGRKC